jgi:hypothetical protein
VPGGNPLRQLPSWYVPHAQVAVVGSTEKQAPCAMDIAKSIMRYSLMMHLVTVSTCVAEADMVHASTMTTQEGLQTEVRPKFGSFADDLGPPVVSRWTCLAGVVACHDVVHVQLRRACDGFVCHGNRAISTAPCSFMKDNHN